MWTVERERILSLANVAPVTGPQRAVTHCDRACTPQVLHYPDSCSLSATTAAALSSSLTLVRADYAPQPTHALPTDPREPSSLHQPAPRMLLRTVLPTWPTQSRLLRDEIIFDFEICPIKSLNLSTSHKRMVVLLSYPVLCPCAPRPHFVFTLLPFFISYLLFILFFAYCHLHYLTRFISRCIRSKACAQTFRELFIWALTLTYPLRVCLALHHRSGQMKTFQCA